MEITNQSTEKGNVCSIDRLSALPDSVLCHILSFLPTELSVATSILAKRWRFLWALVPDLRFTTGRLHTELSNLDIINRVMSLYKVQSMNTFCLHSRMCTYDDIRTKFQLDTCIAAAVARNVKILDLYPLPMFSPYLFTCKTLVELRLYCAEIPTKGTVCLPALKRLHLHFVKGESNESLPNLLSGCPVLEELEIYVSATNEYMDCWHICSSTLKILILNSNSLMLSIKAFGLKLDTPALEYLRTEDFIFKDVSAEVLTHLIEADIDFDEDAHFSWPCSTIAIFGSICNVKRLKLKTGSLKASDSIFSDLTMKFHRLTKLELAGDWRFLSCFLGNADNLEILILHKVNTDVLYWMEPEHELNTDLQYWMEPQNVPICLSSHLRIVRIFGRLATEAEFESISYILRNAKVLERMEICPQHNGTEFKA